MREITVSVLALVSVDRFRTRRPLIPGVKIGLALSRYWLEYFVAYTTSLLEIPWGRGAEITAADRRCSAC